MTAALARRSHQLMLTVVAGLLATACASEPLAPPPADSPEAASLATPVQPELRRDPLGACDSLAVPAGSQLALRTYAEGVQVYRWSGTAWDFVAPEATLYPNERGRGIIGSHYAGPTWELRGGSTVKGAVLKRCTASANAIPWLLLSVTAPADRGLFRGVTHIQRLATQGGLAPSTAGTTVGEERRIPYTAVYRFYRAR